ncbi:MAG: PIG-L family deacetylase [Candidatus Peribacteraceae bacterium]|jgi:LmbE family N-acetylglucosaminyl deacetylase
MSETVLAIGAHIDDIEIGCGGTLLKHRDAGDKIVLAILNADEELTANPVVRQSEQVDSSRMLGGCVVHLFDADMSIEEKVCVLDAVQPTILYFPFEHDYHQHHNAASQVGFAVSRNVRITVLRYLVTTSHSYYPNYLSVINIEAKKKLVSLFESQMSRRPKFMETMVAQNRFFGSLIPGDGHHAEGFVLHRTVAY